VGAVTVTLLGGFSATADGEPVPEGAGRPKKARELVKLLALAPDHRLHREQVMWAEYLTVIATSADPVRAVRARALRDRVEGGRDPRQRCDRCLPGSVVASKSRGGEVTRSSGLDHLSASGWRDHPHRGSSRVIVVPRGE
jgi:hypothetical protein